MNPLCDSQLIFPATIRANVVGQCAQIVVGYYLGGKLDFYSVVYAALDNAPKFILPANASNEVLAYTWLARPVAIRRWCAVRDPKEGYAEIERALDLASKVS